LIVRKARQGDLDAVIAFASRTWHDWDYMPQAFPRWLEESDGVMLVGTAGPPTDGSPALDADAQPLEPDVPLAIVRVALAARREAWLEGIRVDPRVRGMDVATDLQVAELHWSAVQGASVVRYATSWRNEASQRLGARGGFELLVRLRSAWWSATGDPDDDDGESGFLPHIQGAVNGRRWALLDACAGAGLVAATDDSGPTWQRLADDPSFSAARAMYEPRPWALEALTEAKLHEHARRGELLVRGRGVAILVREQPPAEDSALRLALLAGEPNAAFELLEQVRELAAETIKFRFAEDAPLVEAVRQRYDAAGYIVPEWTMLIMARPLDADHPAPNVDERSVILADTPAPELIPARP